MAKAFLSGQTQPVPAFDTTPTADSTNPVTSGGVKTALDGKVSRSTKYSGLLVASNWTSDKKYTFANTKITSTCVVELLPHSSITQAQFEALVDAMIVGGAQAAGSIQLVALGDVPTIDIPITFIIRGDL